MVQKEYKNNSIVSKTVPAFVTIHTQSINLFAPERHNGLTDHEKPLVMVDGGRGMRGINLNNWQRYLIRCC
jgi:hypothetical protein